MELCEVIYMNGYSLEESEVDEDTAAFAVIKFGDLFKMYTRISDKVVGILLRAKKYRLVYFEPEMLFQGTKCRGWSSTSCNERSIDKTHFVFTTKCFIGLAPVFRHQSNLFFRTKGFVIFDPNFPNTNEQLQSEGQVRSTSRSGAHELISQSQLSH